MKTTKLLTIAVAFSAAYATLNAHGQNLTATLNGISPGLTITGTIDNGSFIQGYPTGVMNFTNSDGTNFNAFCVDPTQDLSYGETLVYQFQNPLSLANSDSIARLVGGYLASAQTDRDASAVQWAIWEITTESLKSPSLHDGNVRIINQASATAALANQYLANLGNYTPATLTYLTNSTRQDVVTWCPVPEPTSAGLAALSSLLLLRRRRH